jgi:hypothetical protein
VIIYKSASVERKTCAAEFFLQRPNFSEDLAENICQELATLLSVFQSFMNAIFNM